MDWEHLDPIGDDEGEDEVEIPRTAGISADVTYESPPVSDVPVPMDHGGHGLVEEDVEATTGGGKFTRQFSGYQSYEVSTY